MKTLSFTSLLLLVLQFSAFSPSSFSGLQFSSSVRNNSHGLSMEYVPSGMSKDQWRKMKELEKNKNKGKNLGKTGITSFKSRSFADWQASGGKNLFPVDPRKVKDPKEIPYMQRPGGAPDDSDIKTKGGLSLFGAKKNVVPEKVAPSPGKKTNWWTL